MPAIPQGYCHDLRHAGQEIGHSLQTSAVLSHLLPSGHCHCGERLRTCQPGLANRDLDSRLGCNGRSVYRQRQSLGRIHCYVTGPFFLVAALATLLYGIGVIPLGANGWNLIGMAILIGAIVLGCVPQLLFGKYRGN